MTENEEFEKAIMVMKQHKCEEISLYGEEYSLAILALQEIQQYRSIGTVEECREAMEKQGAKMPDVWGDGYDDEGNMIYDMYTCPNCGENYEIDYDDYDYCPKCGQRMDKSNKVFE